MSDLSYKEYMDEVDEYLEDKCGMGWEDLPDYSWRDLFDDEIPAQEAAEMFCESEGMTIV